MSDFTKTVRPGMLPTDDGNRVSVFCKIKFTEGQLSITGVIGPNHHGDSYGGAGQIDMEFAHRNPEDDDARYSSLIAADDFSFAEGWDAARWLEFLDVWKRWHLNAMRAECAHQRELGWTYATHRGQECPTCGYQIGTAWLSEDVPSNVIEFLLALPDTDRTPAWV